MLCEKILGRADQTDLSGRQLDYVNIEWFEAFKKIHKKVTDKGEEVGIRLDDTVLSRGLYEGDILYLDKERALVVHTPKCMVIRVKVDENHPHMAAKVCYEIGNRHAPLFYGEEENTFITPYNEPMYLMLEKLHGVTATKEIQRLDFDRRISAAVHNHHH
ncbi:MAG TPA: urease accessory protein UreE [Candidatus Ruminococcus avistercoris]|nr:urease accessory protein UreE [Candidatus Ruminococcus avistercoris]